METLITKSTAQGLWAFVVYVQTQPAVSKVKLYFINPPEVKISSTFCYLWPVGALKFWVVFHILAQLLETIAGQHFLHNVALVIFIALSISAGRGCSPECNTVQIQLDFLVIFIFVIFFFVITDQNKECEKAGELRLL